MERESNSNFQFPPGFRFHPSDEELIVHYLLNKVHSRPLPASVIADIELYNYNPWDLPKKALFGEDEWYFFSPRDRKYPNGARPNRAAASGYWKATGTDKPIFALSGSKIGVKKALVFYTGRPSKGIKTDWTMNEYRLLEETNQPSRSKGSMRLDEWVLCRVRKKGNMSKNTWEVQESPGKELPGYLPKIEELPSVHKRTKTEIITDYLPKDCRMLAYILGHQDLPPIETISGARFQCSNDINNCGSIHDDGSDKGNSRVTVSSLDNFFSPFKGKQPKGNSYENLFLSSEMVTSGKKGEGLPQGNTPNTKSTNFNSQNPYQGYIFSPSISDTIISLQEFNDSFFTGRFLQS